eukprot:CAMPEP_0194034854 /NCGR_PEP_ID=MMETSP0009_2-20130614/7302_1 /TAXON_ID=210454 /ORGANISM="Grammatophora oceanica, Strain CCMP 410" /LENGTH=546 /DNA_ID=CAMNT_0038675957 /DNA_START=139 /DNA_END=1780 /DNA_ORIENTATION=+
MNGQQDETAATVKSTSPYEAQDAEVPNDQEAGDNNYQARNHPNKKRSTSPPAAFSDASYAAGGDESEQEPPSEEDVHEPSYSTNPPPIGQGFKQVPAKISKVLEEKWERMFKKLLDYKARFGNTLVPNRYDVDPSLGAWVSTQRRQYKVLMSGSCESTPITPERAARLETIGFVWKTGDPRHVPWDDRFKELLEFKKKYGHVLVPIGYKDNTKLGNWVSTQRQERRLLRLGRKSTRLTQERIEMLDKIGFIWEAQRGGARSSQKRKPKDEDGNKSTPKKPAAKRRRQSSSDATKSKKGSSAKKRKKPPSPMPYTNAADLNSEFLEDRRPPPVLSSQPEPELPVSSSSVAALPVHQHQLINNAASLRHYLNGANRYQGLGLVPSATPLIDNQFHNSHDPLARLRLLQAEGELQTRLNQQLQLRQALGASVPFRAGASFVGENVSHLAGLGSIPNITNVHSLLGTAGSIGGTARMLSTARDAALLARLRMQQDQPRFNLGGLFETPRMGMPLAPDSNDAALSMQEMLQHARSEQSNSDIPPESRFTEL